MSRMAADMVVRMQRTHITTRTWYCAKGEVEDKSLYISWCETHHDTPVFLEVLVFLQSKLEAQQDKAVDAQRQNLQKKITLYFFYYIRVSPQAPPRSSPR